MFEGTVYELDFTLSLLPGVKSFRGALAQIAALKMSVICEIKEIRF